MFTITIEKISPPITIAGLTAELAEVTRIYVEGSDTELDGPPRIKILWGEVANTKLAELTKKQLDLEARTAAGAKELQDLAAVLTSVDVIIDPIKVIP